YLRLNFARPDVPVLIYGPAGTTRAIHHRLRGVTWNLIAGQPGEFLVTDVLPDRLVAARFLTAEAFELAHSAGEAPFEGIVYEADGLTVEARIMDHGIPCLAYAVRELPQTSVDVAALAALGLRPGRWIQEVKDPKQGDDEDVIVGEATHRLGELRRRL